MEDMEPELDERSDDEVNDSIVAKHRCCAPRTGPCSPMWAEQDRREAWTHYGAKSEEAHLIATLGLSFRAARDWVNASQVLQFNDEVSARYQNGELSADQLATVVEMLRIRLPRPPNPWAPSTAPSPHPSRPPTQLPIRIQARTLPQSPPTPTPSTRSSTWPIA